MRTGIIVRHAPRSNGGTVPGTLLATAAALALWPATGALAQDAAADDEDGNAIVVSGERAIAGTKTDTPIVEVPQGISVVTAEEIRDRTAVDFQDVFRYTPGVSAATSVDARGDFVISRGFDAAQYLDGLKRMPDFIYGARLEPFTLESAEVLRGPSSVLYGAGGAGGVLNGRSKRPQFTLGGQVAVFAGTDERIQGQFDVTGPVSDDVAVRLVGLWRDAETQFGTPDDRVLINPSIRFQPTMDTDVTLIGLYQNDQQGSLGYSPLYQSLLAPSETEKVDFNFYQGEPGLTGTDTEYSSIALLLTQRIGDWGTFNSNTRFSDMNTDYSEVYANYTADPFVDAEETLWKREWYVNLENSQIFNSDNNLTVELDTGLIEHQLLFGVDYTWFKQDKDEGYSFDNSPDLPFGSPPPIDIYNPVYGQPFDFGPFYSTAYDNEQLGIYVQDQISFADRVHVVLGLRRDTATSKNGGVEVLDQTEWSFRGGIIAEIVPGLSPYFNYAESFLPVPGGDFYGNPYEPQLANQYEVGVKWEPMANALVAVSYFDIEETNFLSQDTDNIQNFLQGGSVGSTGVEVEGTWRVPDDIDVTASYSYIDAKVTAASTSLAEGDRIAGQAKHLASGWVSKTFDLGDWGLRTAGGVRYIGDRIDISQTLLTPAVTLADIAIAVMRGPWELTLTSSNIFNTRYFDLCSQPAPGRGTCIPAKDRTILAGVRRTF